MDQISRPFLVALVAVIGFAGAWMTVLRPKAETEVDSPDAPVAAPARAPATSKAPGVSGLTRSVDKARAAARASEAADARTQAATETAGRNPVAAPRSAPAAKSAPVAQPARDAAARAPAGQERPQTPTRRPTVVLFAGRGADDAVARDVVRSVRQPGVRTIIASLGEVGRYRDLIHGVQITAAPTILVIGADRRARIIEGLPDEAQVRQALAALG